MTHAEAVKPLDSAIWEMSEAFADLRPEDLWVRAHPRLLSVGELAAHVACGEIHSVVGKLASPLFLPQFRYYPYTIEECVVLPFGPAELYDEVKRVHEECKAHFLSERPELGSKSPLRPDWTWGYTMEYMAFHIAYHTGQMYSVRHLLGHVTADN